MSEVSIRTTMHPSDAEQAAVLDVLQQYTRHKVPSLDNHDFAAFVTTDDVSRVVGGLIGSSRWGGFHVELIALPDALRGKGYGAKLLDLAEQEARRRNCHHMLLDTYDFQARHFYERRGFHIFGEIEGPAPYYPRYFMKKQLS
ncbi:MAG: GNAT family N-acetyltransferase [Sphingopyxis sp.]|uniref:GNAT family N-acetyltransferase n=1 Tax=Sphingopyxis sp. TaxID=1908224 RepID=UPI001A4EB3B8|nr:GNAT family N-acetyltransferase [Sphingopyxis sp.]MBL9070902.1 GNAT family N-acetyltransferase [Sphingopyxis sp.]